MNKKIWGQLLSIDLHTCKPSLVDDRAHLAKFSPLLCQKIKMVPHGKPILKCFGKGSLHGWSSIQFIETSTITTHLDPFGNRAFIDIFSCKKFDAQVARKFCQEYFQAKKIISRNIYR